MAGIRLLLRNLQESNTKIKGNMKTNKNPSVVERSKLLRVVIELKLRSLRKANEGVKRCVSRGKGKQTMLEDYPSKVRILDNYQSCCDSDSLKENENRKRKEKENKQI